MNTNYSERIIPTSRRKQLGVGTVDTGGTSADRCPREVVGQYINIKSTFNTRPKMVANLIVNIPGASSKGNIMEYLAIPTIDINAKSAISYIEMLKVIAVRGVV